MISFYRYVYWFKRKVPRTYKPVILITGCGNGIGLSLASLFFKYTQYRVVITARKKHMDRLKQRFPESDRFLVRDLDITNIENQKTLVAEISELWSCVDIIINNAGISYRSVVEHMTYEDEVVQMSTNYMGPMSLIRLALPGMRDKGRGKIINISSVSGMLAMPTMSSYSASKYALEGASESLWYEMRPFGIDVSMIQLGFVRSDSFENVYYTQQAKIEEKEGGPYSAYYNSMKPFVTRLMKWSRTTPDQVAKLVLDVVQTRRPPLWVPATIDAEFFYYLRRLMPRRLLHPFLFYMLPGARKWGKNYTHKQ